MSKGHSRTRGAGATRLVMTMGHERDRHFSGLGAREERDASASGVRGTSDRVIAAWKETRSVDENRSLSSWEDAPR